MRAVVQRVREARVEVAGATVASIGRGLLVLLAVERGDGEQEAAWLAEKLIHLRIFPDDEQRMNRSVLEAQGSVLSVSQFTLASRVGKGRRPDFTAAEEPVRARTLYETFNRLLAERVPVATGVFAADMTVVLANWGPVTFILERNGIAGGGREGR
ncbi:MAG TPA: D-aminoacyl-tRNA deacylase [Candidatus Aminicenantes bacterium]|nr:D-aminoacyl-tRNA deacylase [Candidatus Aminicenantes bacterium]